MYATRGGGLLAIASLLLLPALAMTQRHGGGGHAGGGHAGGGHAGGVPHGGVPHGGVAPHAVAPRAVSPGGHHAIHDGRFHDGRFHDGRFHHSAFFFGYGYPGFYGYPYYSSYSYYDPWYYGYRRPYAPYYDTPYIIYQTPPSGYEPPVMPYAEPVAYINVRVPADAELWFEGEKTGQKGAMRRFESPPITPGRDYSYEIKATWREGDHEVTQTRQVVVRAGQQAVVDFTRPAEAPATRAATISADNRE